MDERNYELVLYVPRDNGQEIQLAIPVMASEYWPEVYAHLRDKGVKVSLFVEHSTKVKLESWNE